ncbi:phage holin [Scatolibacter rhodanostii]|uniref:phage holin n=1 Tax=Scatolibacter rhodanostii TaxID=2014781 RepID=UPI000C07A8C5|nr:phage holin [Scatolibacter rhodanostii]
MKDNKISAGTIARTACLLLALINQILVMFDKSPLSLGDETITALVSTAATIVTSIIAWWKNNSITAPAIEADKLMHNLKDKEAT